MSSGALSKGTMIKSFEDIRLPSSGMKVFQEPTSAKKKQKGMPGLRKISNTGDIPSKNISKNVHAAPKSSLLNKTNLVFEGDLDSIANNWTSNEVSAKRRLVQFWKRSEGNNIICTFEAMSIYERASNNIVVSCIYWENKNDYFITSVDCIHLLESLISVRFTVEEKNRIRRNLEGFRPLTASKSKSDSSDFYRLIMSYPNPKPRNIEKDVKVFRWKLLQSALKKIIGKYTSSYNQKNLQRSSHSYMGHLNPMFSPSRDFNESPLWTPEFGFNNPSTQGILYSTQVPQLHQFDYGYHAAQNVQIAQGIYNSSILPNIYSSGSLKNPINENATINQKKSISSQVYTNQIADGATTHASINKKRSLDDHNATSKTYISGQNKTQSNKGGMSILTQGNSYNYNSDTNFFQVTANQDSGNVGANISGTMLSNLNNSSAINTYISGLQNNSTNYSLERPGSLYENAYVGNSGFETLDILSKSINQSLSSETTVEPSKPMEYSNISNKVCSSNLSQQNNMYLQNYPDISNNIMTPVSPSPAYPSNNIINSAKNSALQNFGELKMDGSQNEFIYSMSKTPTLFPSLSEDWGLTGQHSEDSVETISTKYDSLYKVQSTSANQYNIYQANPGDFLYSHSFLQDKKQENKESAKQAEILMFNKFSSQDGTLYCFDGF